MIFGKSSVSSTDNEHFSAISAFRRPTKGAFHRFSHFVGRRRALSCIFSLSSADDRLSLCNSFNNRGINQQTCRVTNDFVMTKHADQQRVVLRNVGIFCFLTILLFPFLFFLLPLQAELLRNRHLVTFFAL